MRRNRLISGLAAFTVVVRAPRRSGALVTADWARRQNRPVFAVPGSPLDPTSAGCLEAIRRGAGLLTTAGDLPRYGAAIPSPSCTAEVAPHQSRQGQLSEIQQAVLRGLGSHPQTLEGLVSKLGRDPQKILVALTELLLSGHIAQTGPGVYQVTRPS